MKKHTSWISFLLVVAVILFFSAAIAAAAQKEQVIKVGKKGNITLTEDTKVGEMTLKAGQYTVQHRVQGSEHFVHFVPAGKTAYKSGPSEMQCSLESLDSKASQTAVYTTREDGSSRVTKVVIRGENVAHVF